MYWTKPMCKCTWAFSSFTHQTSPYPTFLPILGKKLFDGQRRKHLTPLSLSPLPTQPNTLQKVFILHFFSFFFFILPKIHSTKHTLKVSLWNSYLYFPYQLAAMANKLEIGEVIILGSLSFFFFNLFDFYYFKLFVIKKKGTLITLKIKISTSGKINKIFESVN